MSPTCPPPLSLRKLLLLSAFALVTCYESSTALSVSNGQRDGHANTRPETTSNEERIFNVVSALKDLFTVVVMRLSPSKEAFVNNLLKERNSLPKSFSYESPEFMDTADKVMKRYKGEHAMTVLFDVLVRAKGGSDNRVGVWDFYDLVELMVKFRGPPEQPLSHLSVVPGHPAHKAIVDSEKLQNIVLSLQGPLFRFWKSKGIMSDNVFEMLKVNVNSESLFVDPTTLLWIDFVVDDSRGSSSKPFELVLDKVRSMNVNDIGIAVKLAHANAESKPGSVAESLMTTLFLKWTTDHVQMEDLLNSLMPSDVKDYLNGSLKLWIAYNKLKVNEKELFSKLVDTLVKRMSSDAFGPESYQHNEIVLAGLIAEDWQKNYETLPWVTRFPSSSSPLANPMFVALCERWSERSILPAQLWKLLEIKHSGLHSSGNKARRRLWMMFVVSRGGGTHDASLLIKWLTDQEMTELVARLVDWDQDLYEKLSGALYDNWNTAAIAKATVLADFILPHRDERLFQNRELVVWYNYNLDSSVQRFEQILQMRNELKSEYRGKNFESDLEAAVHTVDGELQHILFDLLVSSWIDKETWVRFVPYFGRFPWKMKPWYQKLILLPRWSMRLKKQALSTRRSVSLQETRPEYRDVEKGTT